MPAKKISRNHGTTKYPGKDRSKAILLILTKVGLKALDSGVNRTGDSKTEYIEGLIRRDNGVQE